MPGLVDATGSMTRKRKYADDAQGSKRRAMGSAMDRTSEQIGQMVEVHVLESQILQSQRYYNNLATLLAYAQPYLSSSSRRSQALFSLCRIFSRLMAGGCMTASKQAGDNEIVISKWLHERYEQYRAILLAILGDGAQDAQIVALRLLMQLFKEEGSDTSQGEDSIWNRGTFHLVLQRLVTSESTSTTRLIFAKEYVVAHDDMRLHTFLKLAAAASTISSPADLDSLISVLIAVNPNTSPDLPPDSFYIFPSNPKRNAYSCAAQKRAAQDAWTAVLKIDLTKAQRKKLLGVMSYRIAPWFTRVELLMDFLTDSFNSGGSTSLMALSGLFHLMQEKNLDYPFFYQKLYALLDCNVLHSKHRSRFFRLLESFLASTHLPIILVASFLKRLSRLCLHAPPSAIVVVVPWIYNLLKNHPTCTFMIHREPYEAILKAGVQESNRIDPFRMDEDDPLITRAIESSLWEIETLQTHFHPNVAAIARTISEQFTKQAYNLEDFLDHSYGSMLDTELSKTPRKAPVVEYDIPQRIFTGNEALFSEPTSNVMQLWGFPH